MAKSAARIGHFQARNCFTGNRSNAGRPNIGDNPESAPQTNYRGNAAAWRVEVGSESSIASGSPTT